MRGAAFSGGGFFGNTIVGMLERLSENDDFEPWDCLTGISTGALVVGQIVQHPKHDFPAAVRALRDIYTPRVTKDIHKRWMFGKLAALWKPSIRSSRPLAKLLDDSSDPKKARSNGYRAGVGVVNLESGEYELLELDYTPWNRALEASASMPTLFEPVRLPERGLCVDGGAAIGCDIGSLIRMGCDEIDVFMAVPEKLLPEPMPDPETLDVALRTFEIMLQTLAWQQVQLTQVYNKVALADPSSGKRHVKLRVFAPDRLVGTSMEFVPEQAVELQRIGYDAAEALELQEIGYSDAVEAMTDALPA